MKKQDIDTPSELPSPPQPRIHAHPVMDKIFVITLIVAFFILIYSVSKLLLSVFLK